MQALRNDDNRSAIGKAKVSQTYPAYRLPSAYCIVFGICVLFIALALCLDSPTQIVSGYITIITSTSVLITDYVALAGISAALINAAILGIFYLVILISIKRIPDGKLVAALFAAMGFSLFGKNLINSLPIFMGVLLYTRFYKVDFSDIIANAIFSATLSPIVSEIAFYGSSTSPVKIVAACVVGLFVGFVFPVVTEASKRMHRGYCLYNSGAAGGFIATFVAVILKSTGIEILPSVLWDTTHTFLLASVAYFIGAMMILYGFLADKPSIALSKFRELINENDMNSNDYMVKYGNTCYINIGLMCVIMTSTMLVLKIPINGPVLGGIFTVAGFSAAGKHIKNTFPILLGSIFAAYFDFLELTNPSHALAILFSTGLAPICGKHGWVWGFIIGFLHVSIAVFMGNTNGGINLYNNGFAGSFVAITIVPIIVFLKELAYDPRLRNQLVQVSDNNPNEESSEK